MDAAAQSGSIPRSCYRRDSHRALISWREPARVSPPSRKIAANRWRVPLRGVHIRGNRRGGWRHSWRNSLADRAGRCKFRAGRGETPVARRGHRAARSGPGGHGNRKFVILAVRTAPSANRPRRAAGTAAAASDGSAPEGASAWRSLASPSLMSIIERIARWPAEPRPFGKPGPEFPVMAAAETAAEDSGDVNPIPGTPSRAGQ